MGYDEAVSYLLSLPPNKHSFDELRAVLKKFGSPEEKLRVIHVAGTNGKGTVCRVLSEILQTAGYSAGAFTSPHLRRLNERLRINGAEISDEAFAGLLTRAAEASSFLDNPLSFFELLTVAAFVYFYESRADFVALETGIGGRLDATNIVPRPLLSVITSVSLDHTDLLGGTLEKIAAEKAGIIKENCPIVLHRNPEKVYNLIKETAREKNAPFYYDRADSRASFYPNREPGFLMSLDVSGEGYAYRGLRTNLFGLYQEWNLRGALLAAEVLRRLGLRLTEECAREALTAAAHPGRCEFITKNVLLDGAHNPDGARALAETLAALGRPVVAVVGILRDKAYKEIAQTLAGASDAVIFTKADEERGLPPEELRAAVSTEAAFSGGVRPEKTPSTEAAFCEASPLAAYERAEALRPENGVIVVAGSLRLVGTLRAYILSKG